MESREFRMSGGRFATELIFRYAGIWLLILSVTAVTGIVLGICVDLRWMIVGLMTVFVVIPMVLAFLYYYYGLKRECFVNTIPHKIEVGDDGISVHLRISGPVESDQSDEEDSSSSEKSSEEEPRYRTEFFSFAAMMPYKVGNNSVIIPFKSPAKGFLWIPADAYEDVDMLSETLRFIDSRTAGGVTPQK